MVQLQVSAIQAALLLLLLSLQVSAIQDSYGVRPRVRPEEVAMLASYLAAVTHDYEHRGLNNDFLVRVGDELAFT